LRFAKCEQRMKARTSCQVSVIIPTTGRATLPLAVRSALSQVGVTVEVLIVVDGVAERQEAILGEVAELPNVRIIRNAQTRGGAFSRNVGTHNAIGEYVAFLDDDDWWESDKLARQLRAATRNKPAQHVLVATGFYFHRVDGSKVTLPRAPLGPDKRVSSYLLCRSGFSYGHGAIPSSVILVDRRLLNEIRWDETLRRHQDWDFVIRVLERSDVDFIQIQDPLAHIRQGSIASVSRSQDWRSSLDWIEDIRDFVTPRARADFLAAYPGRIVMANRSLRGLVEILKRWPLAFPHLGAFFVMLSGLIGDGPEVRLVLARIKDVPRRFFRAH
jgi:glycosyltransferase involved in cell wall biosynthesis